MLTLKNEYMYLSDEEEKAKLAKLNRVKYHCPNTILHEDGTLIALALEPQCLNYGDYHGRKIQWSLTKLIIGDDNDKIYYYLTGFLGSSHDNRVWKWSVVYLLLILYRVAIVTIPSYSRLLLQLSPKPQYPLHNVI